MLHHNNLELTFSSLDDLSIHDDFRNDLTTTTAGFSDQMVHICQYLIHLLSVCPTSYAALDDSLSQHILELSLVLLVLY